MAVFQAHQLHVVYWFYSTESGDALAAPMDGLGLSESQPDRVRYGHTRFFFSDNFQPLQARHQRFTQGGH